MHIACLVEKTINHVVLIWTIKFNVNRSKRSPSEFVLPGKLKDFWNFTSFLATKTSTCLKFSLKETLWTLFLWTRFNCLKVGATSRRQFAFYHYVPRNSRYSFYRPQKDERLSWPWSHPVILSTRPLDWESSPLTTRSLFLVIMCIINTFT